jgi:parallel beta-helix repeat protein
MKRTALALTLVSALLMLTASLQVVILTSANPIRILPYITIERDGIVNPLTDLIKQVGNVYSLTDNILQKYAIVIQCSNILFDGAGNAIDGTGYDNQGLTLEGVTNVTIKNLIVKGFNNYGISLQNCERCSVLGVNLTHNSVGLCLRESNSNTVAVCNVDHNYYGIQIYYSNNNVFFGNNITETTSQWSIDMLDSHDNTIFQNNLVGNSVVVMVESSMNSWDNGSLGNYWSDYNGIDTNRDGIGDAPYVINANNQDYFPLMTPVKVSNPLPNPVDATVPSITVLSPENKTYDASSIPLNFTVNEPVLQITYSFDGAENITITGNTTLTGLANGDHNLTIYAKDEAGNLGVSETINFTVAKQPEPEPFPTATVAAVSGASAAVVVSAGLVVYFKKRKCARINQHYEIEQSST